MKIESFTAEPMQIVSMDKVQFTWVVSDCIERLHFKLFNEVISGRNVDQYWLPSA